MPTTVVVGAQAGSEGKGAICGRLAKSDDWDYTVRVGGPNAGHCVMGVGSDNKKYALRQLPVGMVTNPKVHGVIAAGSEIEIAVLMDEIKMLEWDGYEIQNRLIIDEEATIVAPYHAKREVDELGGVPSGNTTAKGIGAARADRAMRKAKRMKDMRLKTSELCVTDTQTILQEAARRDQKILIEGTQGFILGSRAGYYPKCTSGDCRAVDALAAAGLTKVDLIWLVARTYPIRIAGDSGPMWAETSWERLGLEPEITTVTKKTRRVADWNPEWVARAAQANGAGVAGIDVRMALTFVDYWYPELHGVDELWTEEMWSPETKLLVEKMELLAWGAKLSMLGTGPSSQIRLER